jgi:hypothetical protein
MLIKMVSHANCLQVEHVANTCRKNGHPAFVKKDDRRLIAVPSLNDASPVFLTRWALATIERIEPTDDSFDLVSEGFLEAEKVFI